MGHQPTSYWLTVFLFGPIGGLVNGLTLTAVMSLEPKIRFVDFLLGPGLLYGLFMGLMFTAMMAVLAFNVRRQVQTSDIDAVRTCLLKGAKKLRLRVLEDHGTYLRLRPKWGLFKPECSAVHVWIEADTTILTGPLAVIPGLCKKLASEAGR
jgi:hypothetical protein